jgi:hypothetical protein
VVPDERELGQIQLDKWPSGSGGCDYFIFCEIKKRKRTMVLLVSFNETSSFATLKSLKGVISIFLQMKNWKIVLKENEKFQV